MTTILDCAKSITNQRDHVLLDKAMVDSLFDLVIPRRGNFALRLYRVANLDARLRITLTAWTDGLKVNYEEVECDTTAAPNRMIEALTQDVVGADAMEDENLGTLHFIWLPIRHNNELLGCIELGTTKAITHRRLALIDGMRGLYANFLSLLQYSQRDSLTQLLNRKTFDDGLAKLLAKANSRSLNRLTIERRSENEEACQWLAVLDIDHFKNVNDTFGHLFGDEVLVLVASLMRKVFRGKDKLFRFGGEEFVVLLRDANEHNARRAFERFRVAMENYTFPTVGKVTISIGVTRVQSEDKPAAALGRADGALYLAKKNGRNQVRFFESTT